MSLVNIIAAIQDTAGAITGIRAAPDEPPENVNGVLPVSLCFPDTGSYDNGPGYGTYEALHNIRLQLHFPRADLAHSIAVAKPYGDAVAKAFLADPSIDATCDTFDKVNYVFGPLKWGDADTIGWDFTLTNVKEIGSVT